MKSGVRWQHNSDVHYRTELRQCWGGRAWQFDLLDLAECWPGDAWRWATIRVQLNYYTVNFLIDGATCMLQA